MSEKIQNAQKIILRIAAVIGFVFFSIELFYYIAEEYKPFLLKPLALGAYFLSALRLICRLGFLASLVGIYVFRRWACLLLLAVWLLDLLFSAGFYFATKGYLSTGHYNSFFGLLATGGLLYWSRALFKGKDLTPILLLVGGALLAHTLLYLAMHVDALI